MSLQEMLHSMMALMAKQHSSDGHLENNSNAQRQVLNNTHEDEQNSGSRIANNNVQPMAAHPALSFSGELSNQQQQQQQLSQIKLILASLSNTASSEPAPTTPSVQLQQATAGGPFNQQQKQQQHIGVSTQQQQQQRQQQHHHVGVNIQQQQQQYLGVGDCQIFVKQQHAGVSIRQQHLGVGDFIQQQQQQQLQKMQLELLRLMEKLQSCKSSNTNSSNSSSSSTTTTTNNNNNNVDKNNNIVNNSSSSRSHGIPAATPLNSGMPYSMLFAPAGHASHPSYAQAHPVLPQVAPDFFTWNQPNQEHPTIHRTNSASSSSTSSLSSYSTFKKSTPANSITIGQLQSMFHVPIVDAAKGLGVSQSAIKRACRRYGIKKWPFRKISAARRHMAAAQTCATRM